MPSVKLIVKCVYCGHKKTLKASDGPHGIQICRKDGGVMLPVAAKGGK